MSMKPSSEPGRFEDLPGPEAGRKTVPWQRLLSALLIFLVVVLLPALAGSQEPSLLESRDNEQYLVRENVNYVILHPTVQDRKASPVSGLSIRDFQVYEDGVLQEIKFFTHEDTPVTVGLIVDNSGSMRQKRPEVIAAALAFARSSNPEDEMFAVSFNENVSFGLPEGTLFTDKLEYLEIALSRISANGMTALYDAVAAGFGRLTQGSRDKKVLIVVSDGADNASKLKLAQIITKARQSNAIVYTVGVFDQTDPDRNPRVLRQLARDTGGEAFFPHTLREVVPVCEHIANIIRNQYTLGYVPTNRKQDGSYRRVEVKASEKRLGRLTVRARHGYFAPTNSQSDGTRPQASGVDKK
jgi:Ca-activated chloride channel homolog